MAWILFFSGIFILLAVVLIPLLKRRHAYHLDQPPVGSFDVYIKEAASRCGIRGFSSLPDPTRYFRCFQKSVSRLNALHEDQQSPAAKKICENASLVHPLPEPSLTIKRQKLPRDLSGKTRIALFAKAFLSCTNCKLTEELLKSGIEAWSACSPLTESELESMPHAFYNELMIQVCHAAKTCLHDQFSANAARQAHLLKKYGKQRSAKKIMQRNARNRAFQAALYELENPAPWMGEACLISDDAANHLISEEKRRQTQVNLLAKNAFLSLNLIEHFPWKQIRDQTSPFHRFFVQDEVYRQMDEESRILYRRKASRIAYKCKLSDREVGAAVMELCNNHFGHTLYRHCGYYLLDDGYADLLAHLHRLTPLRRLQITFHSKRSLLLTALPWFVFLLLLCAGFVLGYALIMLVPIAAIFTDAFFRLMEKLDQTKKHPLPRIQLDALPQDKPVLVVCSAVLSSAEQALEAVRQLSRLSQNNPDPQMDFLLLGDFHDSLTLTSSLDSMIVSAASSGIRTLCATSGRRFLYLQRERTRIPGEESCHGRDRRRGALETVLRLIRDREIQDRFAYASFDPSELNGHYRYVAAFDKDMFCTNILSMAGVLMHPLNRRRKAEGRFRGASVIRPAKHSDPHMLNTSFGRWLHTSDSDIQTEELLIGLIDPEPFLSSAASLPRGGILHSSLIDEFFAGCMTDFNVFLYQSAPNTLIQELETLHRLTRGLWQLFPLLIPLPGQSVFKHTDAADRAKIRRKVLRTLVGPLRLLVMLYSAFSGRSVLLLLTFLLPAIAESFPFSSLSAIQSLFVRQMILPCTAFVQADAFGRAIYRLFISRKKLMEWTPAIRLNSGTHQRSMLLFGINMSSAGILAFGSLYQQTWTALIPAAFWAMMTFVLPYMEQNGIPKQER